jgi:nucleoside-diphosphate-sugar epimerase
MTSIVFGATAMVGRYIAEHLMRDDEKITRVSRKIHGGPQWVQADLQMPQTLNVPKSDAVFCAVNARLFAKALPRILDVEPKRVVVISSTSVFTKHDSADESERTSIAELIDAEHAIMRTCEAAGVQWTILRPTLIYKEGSDRNISVIAEIIRRLRVMPLYGSACGLRQPVHAEDLAIGAIAAMRSQRAANRAYCTTGAETLTYREMVGRIFDGLSLPRRLLPLPPTVWKSAFAVAKPFYPAVTSVMGERMVKDQAFDSSPAAADFGWRTRRFTPSFN